MSTEPKLITVDVWNTALRRICAEDDVRYHTARFLQLHFGGDLSTERRTLDALVEARRAQALTETTLPLRTEIERWLDAVAPALQEPLRTDLIQELVACELRFEAFVCRLDSGISDRLEPYRGTDVVLVSDDRLSGFVLRRLAHRAGFPLPVRAAYASSDVGHSKRSGELFVRVQQDLGVLPSEHLHLGDDPIEDVEVPRSLGIACVHYVAPEDRSSIGALHGGADAATSAPERANTSAVTRMLDSDRTRLFALGQRFATPFVAFVYSVLEHAVGARHTDVYYFTREGVFFREIHDLIADHNPLPAFLPRSHLLEVSRLATFGPSLRSVSLDELMRVWSQYTTQSLATLFGTLDLPLDDYRTFLLRHELDPNEPIDLPWLHAGVQALFADREFVSKVESELEIKRTRALAYLEQKGLSRRTARCAVVDIGWRGTIQDNLAHLLPDTQFDGFYFGLHPYLNAQPPNTTKRGVYMDLNLGAFDDAQERVFAFPSVVEMMCNSATGSVLRYERTSDGVRAVVANEASEDKVWYDAIQHFQAGVLDRVPHLCEELRMRPREASVLRDQGLAQLVQLVQDPPVELTRAYFSLSHNETFGYGGFIEKRARFPLVSFVRGFRKLRYRKRFVRQLEATGWPQGALRRLGFGPLIPLYNEGRLESPPREWIRR